VYLHGLFCEGETQYVEALVQLTVVPEVVKLWLALQSGALLQL
jgi:hypothetical protein